MVMTGPTKHILIVDDEQLVRYSLSAAFGGKDTEVISMPDARSALKALGEWVFDLCFLDVQLPDANGIDIMRMIRQLSPKTRIVMMTGSVLESSAMNSVRENAFLFLNKPFDLFRVKRVLDALSPRDENVYQEFEELEARVAERRRHRRKVAPRRITFVTVPAYGEEREQYYSGDLLDISETGTRISTPYQLEPGRRVQFKNSVNEALGIVRWSANDKQKDRYLAGIQFIGPDGN